MMTHPLSHDIDSRSDHELLERFLRDQSDDSFAMLVERHGPMVLGVCRRLLQNSADADDAFQATFLTLVRKGGSIRRKMALPNWLYRVSVRIALRQRTKAQKHSTAMPLPDVAVRDDPADRAAWREAAEVLDRELYGLPEKYRTPLIMCCVDGFSYEEAAAELGWPVGTVAIRLKRGRDMLRRKLVRRGLVLGAGFLAANALWPQAQASVPAKLASGTAKAGKVLHSGTGSDGVSRAVSDLVKAECKSLRRPLFGPIVAGIVGVVAISVIVFVLVTTIKERRFQAPSNAPGPAVRVPAMQQNRPRGFTPGWWVGRRTWRGEEWIPMAEFQQVHKTAPAPGAAQEKEVIFGFAFVSPNIRQLPDGSLQGFTLFTNFTCFILHLRI
jgi:RNA polymerase sigma factor (sigma-70 family)